MSDALPLSRGFSLGHLLVHQVRRRLRPAGWLVQRRRKHPDGRSISNSTRRAQCAGGASSISLWHSSRYKNLDLTICAIWYLSVPSRGSCDPAEWTVAHSRWRGVQPSTRRGRGCFCASWGGTKLSPPETTRRR